MNLGRFAVNLINIFVGAVTVALGLRFILKLFGANSSNDFVQWVYATSDVLLDPFRGIFPAREIANGFVFEFSTFFALIVYAILGMFAVWAVAALTPSPTVVTKKVRK